MFRSNSDLTASYWAQVYVQTQSVCDGRHEHRHVLQTAMSINTSDSERPRRVLSRITGGRFQIFYTFNFLLSFELFVSSQLCCHGHAREPLRCYAEQIKQRLRFSPSLCVLLCMPLSRQIDRKRKRSTGEAWNRTLEGSAFTECPICNRQASPVYLFVSALPC